MVSNFFDHIYKSLNRPEVKKDYPQYASLTAAIEAVTKLDLQQVRSGILPVHLSTATKFCSRQHYLMFNAGRKFYKNTSVAQKLMWGFGRSSEKFCKDSIIQAYGPENIYGEWTCKCQSMKMIGLGIDPYNVLCNVCKTTVLYHSDEATFFYDDLIAGHPDVLLLNEYNELEVIELKSISADGFKKLTEPSEDYIKQGYGYLKLLEKNKDALLKMGITPKLDSFRILYSSKGFLFSGSVQKEFIMKVKNLPPNIELDFEEAVESIRYVKDTKTVPERTKCKTESCPMAKECPVVAECFSGR